MVGAGVLQRAHMWCWHCTDTVSMVHELHSDKQ